MPNNEKLCLGVNIDHVATIRQARLTSYPEPIQAALLAEEAGADSITAHLREDRRHMRDRDMELLREIIQTRLNMEMAVTDEMVAIASRIKPQSICLVPEQRQELTTEGGLDVLRNIDKVRDACARLADSGCEVSVFIDPDTKQIDATIKAGAPVIELHTGCFANARDGTIKHRELERIRSAANYANQAGLKVNAGHGLHYHNVQEICRIPQVSELNIGHAIVARALFSGFPEAVREMKNIMLESRNDRLTLRS